MSAEKLAFWLPFYPARSVFNQKWQSFLHIWVISTHFPLHFYQNTIPTNTKTPTTWYPPISLGWWSVRIDLCHAVIRPSYISDPEERGLPYYSIGAAVAAVGGWGTSNCAADFFSCPPPLYCIWHAYSSQLHNSHDKDHHPRRSVRRTSIQSGRL